MGHDFCQGWIKSLCREFYNFSSALLYILKLATIKPAKHTSKHFIRQNCLLLQVSVGQTGRGAGSSASSELRRVRRGCCRRSAMVWACLKGISSRSRTPSAVFSIDTYTEALKAALSGVNKPHPWCNVSTANTKVGRLPSAPSESCGGLGDVSFQIVSSAVRASAEGAACLF